MFRNHLIITTECNAVISYWLKVRASVVAVTMNKVRTIDFLRPYITSLASMYKKKRPAPARTLSISSLCWHRFLSYRSLSIIFDQKNTFYRRTQLSSNFTESYIHHHHNILHPTSASRLGFYYSYLSVTFRVSFICTYFKNTNNQQSTKDPRQATPEKRRTGQVPTRFTPHLQRQQTVSENRETLPSPLTARPDAHESQSNSSSFLLRPISLPPAVLQIFYFSLLFR